MEGAGDKDAVDGGPNGLNGSGRVADLADHDHVGARAQGAKQRFLVAARAARYLHLDAAAFTMQAIEIGLGRVLDGQRRTAAGL